MLKNNSVFCDLKLRKREQGESCELLSNRRKGPLNCHHRAQCGLYHFCSESFNPTLCPPAGAGQLEKLNVATTQSGSATINLCSAVLVLCLPAKQRLPASPLHIQLAQNEPHLFFFSSKGNDFPCKCGIKS